MKNRLTMLDSTCSAGRLAAPAAWSRCWKATWPTWSRGSRRIRKRCWRRIRIWPTSCGRISIACGCCTARRATCGQPTSAQSNKTVSRSTNQRRTARQIGDYRIVREIGRGGMGIVYEAHQKSLNRQVALKILPFAAVLDQRQIARFRNEAQAAAQLHHPHIVPVFAVGQEQGVYYYAMQYIDGQSLEQAIAELRHGETIAVARLDEGRRRLPTARRRRCTSASPNGLDIAPSDCATAISFAPSPGWARKRPRRLQHAHEYGIVHRDVKPSNLLVDARASCGSPTSAWRGCRPTTA